MPFCRNCGEATAVGTRFCPKCGADMWNANPSQPASEHRINRMPELILGLIGGVLGLLFIPVMVFLGAFGEAFTGSPGTLYAQAAVAALISIIGLVAAVLVKSKPREWGICLVICGIIGVIVASGFYVGGLLLLVAGILALVRRDSKESQDDLSFLTEEQPRRTGLRGSFPLDELTINKEVSNVSPGVFVLGRKEGKTFYVRTVGRADVDVRTRLKEHIGRYDRFKFEYANSPEDAFRKECDLYHDFRGPEGKLDNENHPERPQGVAWLCTKCNKFSPQGVEQTTT